MRKIIFLLWVLVSVHAIAESIPPTCIKQKPAEPFSGEIPKGFILVPICKDAAPADEYNSIYIFLGDAIVSGI